MENFHVYRDGKYDRKENIKIKLRAALGETIEKLDCAFNRLYEL